MPLPSLSMLFAVSLVLELTVFADPTPAPNAPGVTALMANEGAIPLNAQSVNAAARGAVFRLSTHLEHANSRSQHGTAFAVDTAGLLVTNFHVVRDALLGGKDYRLVLETTEGTVPAVVIAVDVVNDLALVRAGKNFEKVLPIATTMGAAEGEVVYSLGFPANDQLTFAQGNYGGEKPVGFVTAGFATMPLNGGMSGGPMLNGQAEVIGVNRAMVTKAQNLSYFSPLGALREIVNKNAGAGRALASTVGDWKKEAVEAIRHREIQTLGAKRNPKQERLGDIVFTVPLPNQTCGQSKVGKSKEALEAELFICQSNSLTPLVGNSNALEVITMGMVSDKPLVRMAAPLQNALKGFYLKERGEILDLKGGKDRKPSSIALTDEEKVKSRERCGLRNVTNGGGVDMTVSYCTIANGFYDGLFSTFVRIDVRGKTAGANSLVQMYQGMSSEATADALDRFLESLRVEVVR